MKKKVLFLITKSNFGGAQRYVFDLATNLKPTEFEVIVALGGKGQLYEELTQASISTITIDSLERDISIKKELSTVSRLWEIIKSEKPDILHINSSKAGGIGALIGRLCGVPKIIFTAHGWAFNEDRPRWQKLIITFLHWLTVLLSHQTIAVSEITKKQLPLPLVRNKMRVIYNGRKAPDNMNRQLARQYFLAKLPELTDSPDEFWSVTIAELHPIKQHSVTIKSIQSVVIKHPEVRHFIIGEGEQRAELESLVKTLKLENNVFLIGHIPNAPLYLPAFDLFILSSRSEALAYVIIEACQAGLPIIASNVGGIPEIIKHDRNGLLFSSGDHERLALLYETLLSSDEKREELGRQAKVRSKDFELEKMLKETISLYNE